MAERLNYKIVILGDSSVGKSSIITRFVDNYFRPESWSTVALDLRTKQIQIQNKTVKLQIWDTAGQERFRTISSAYYKNANAIVLVFDLLNKKSLQNIQSYWLGEIKKYCEQQPELIILGNKQDQYPMFSKNRRNVSAKIGDGVMEAFQSLVNRCLQKSKAKLTLNKGVVTKKQSGFVGKINRNKKKKQRCY